MSSAKRKRSDSDDVAGSSATSAASDQPPKVPMVKEGSIGKSKEIINIVSNEDDEEDDGAGGEGEVLDTIDKTSLSHNCPYLDTINRHALDFDFEKLCSVNMSNLNVYACLVTGKYFQGRGPGTHAYTHSLMTDNHVFLNLSTLKFYCLPDNYEIIDSSLDDIRFYLKPNFGKEQIEMVQHGTVRSRALDGRTYLPGIVGLNNIKANDYVNVVVQILCRVTPFRNFFLVEDNYKHIKDPLVTTFGELMRKICNPRNFKSHVSPHEFLQAVTTASKRRFKLITQSDPFEFLSWLLNALHLKLKQKGKRSIVHSAFKGMLNISKRKLPPTEKEKDMIDFDIDDPEYRETSEPSPFLILPLDVPPPPLFSDELEHNIIPQVPLFELLNKFDGVTEKEYKTHQDLFVKKFQITKLPKYLIVHIKRFTKNTFFTEKNPTIVNFPVRHLMLKDYVPELEGDDSLYKYDLVANVVHEGLPGAGKGTYTAQVHHKGTNQWFNTQDLHVDEILPQMITLSTSYIQIWERQEDTAEELQGMKEAREQAKIAQAEAAQAAEAVQAAQAAKGQAAPPSSASV